MSGRIGAENTAGRGWVELDGLPSAPAMVTVGLCDILLDAMVVISQDVRCWMLLLVGGSGYRRAATFVQIHIRGEREPGQEKLGFARYLALIRGTNRDGAPRSRSNQTTALSFAIVLPFSRFSTIQLSKA